MKAMKKFVTLFLTFVLAVSTCGQAYAACNCGCMKDFKVAPEGSEIQIWVAQEKVGRVIMYPSPDDPSPYDNWAWESREDGGIVMTIPDDAILLWEDGPQEGIKVETNSGEDVTGMKALSLRGDIFYIEGTSLWSRVNPEWGDEGVDNEPVRIADGVLDIAPAEDPMVLQVFLGKDAVQYEEAKAFSQLIFEEDTSTEEDLKEIFNLRWIDNRLVDSFSGNTVAMFDVDNTPLWGIIEEQCVLYVVLDEGTHWFDYVPAGTRWLRVISTTGAVVEPDELGDIELY